MIDAMLHPDLLSFTTGLMLGTAVGFCIGVMIGMAMEWSRTKTWPFKPPAEHESPTRGDLLKKSQTTRWP
jgi:hypothetical protein